MTKPLSPAAVAVVLDWPADDWLTEADLAERLGDRHPITVGPDGFTIGGKRKLRGVLSEARRAGWVIRNQRFTPPVYMRTDQGAAQAAALASGGVSR